MMRLKQFSRTLFLASLAFLILGNSVFAAPCGPGATLAVCPSGATGCIPCEPPVLPDLEVLVVQLIGTVWVLAGVIFTGIFIYNSSLYMFNQKEEAKKRMGQWLIGLLMLFFSQPAVATLMQLLIDPTNDCFAALRQPTFTFFFPQVCGSAVANPTTVPSVSH